MGEQLDPVSVFVALLTAALGPALASVIGPYAVIVIAASTGAAWALSRRDSRGRLSAALFFTRINFTALLVTVLAAEIVRSMGAPFDTRYLLTPIALLIGGVGDDWPGLVTWAFGRFGKFIDMWIEMRARSKPGDSQ